MSSTTNSNFFTGQFVEPVIMVDCALDEQPQEIVVESTESTIETTQIVLEPVKRAEKQKRKEPLLLRPLNEDDMKLELQIIEAPTTEAEVKVKPRREYRTKRRIQRALEKSTKSSLGSTKVTTKCPKSPKSPKSPPKSPKCLKSSPKLSPRSPKSPRITIKEEPINLPERRTRLSNTCRVATGKTYKCHDCEFSTDRINNIIMHIKESCPKLKRTNEVTNV